MNLRNRWIVLVALLAASTVAHADPVEDAVTKLLEENAGRLVLVEFDLQRIDGRGGQEVTLQGTVVGAGGGILVTNARQIDPSVGGEFNKPEKITVRFPGDVKRQAVFVGKDDELNLALLQLEKEEGEGDDAPELSIATFDAEIAFRAGQPLFAVRRLGMADNDLLTFQPLRVSTVIPRPGLPTEYRVLGSLRGIEGCPIYTQDGRLAGFVSQSTQGRGRSFQIVNGRMVAVPPSGRPGHPTRILDAKEVLSFLSDPTRHTRRDVWLGVKNLQALTKPLAEAYGIESPGGIVVGAVSVGSPADAAGLEPADVIVAVDGEIIDTAKDRDIASFKRRIRLAQTGDGLELRVIRRKGDGLLEVALAATLEEAPLSESEVPEYHDLRFGLKLKPLTRDFLERSRLSVDLTGVRVISVDSASWASIAGIRAGDVIRKMVLKPCENLDQYKEIMADLLETRDSEVCYNVMRSRKSLFLCVRPDWSTVAESDG